MIWEDIADCSKKLPDKPMSRNFSASAQDQEKGALLRLPPDAGKTSLADYKVPKHVEIHFLRFEDATKTSLLSMRL
jgi:hypothetical protein